MACEIHNTSCPVVAGGLGRLAAEAEERFRQLYAQGSAVRMAAPGRVNLIGEHVDYNDGFVLPMAIDRHVVVVAAPSDIPSVRVASSARPGLVEIPLQTPQGPGEPAWANYVRGVIAGFREIHPDLPGIDALVHADLPLGGGLSSSAALEVSFCLVLEHITGKTLSPVDRVRLCQKAEHAFAGVPCGIMDQFIVATAQKDHALLLDCQSLSTRQVHVDSTQVALLVTHCGVAHELGMGEYAKRRADCHHAAKVLGVPSLRHATLEQLLLADGRLSATEQRRARHVVTEIQRTTEFAEFLEAGDWETAGRLMYASHKSLRDDYEVSCAELDLLVAIAQDLGLSRGVLGARMTGGGFGGCTVTLVRAQAATAVQQALVERYRARTGIEAASFASTPVEGARRLATP